MNWKYVIGSIAAIGLMTVLSIVVLPHWEGSLGSFIDFPLQAALLGTIHTVSIAFLTNALSLLFGISFGAFLLLYPTLTIERIYRFGVALAYIPISASVLVVHAISGKDSILWFICMYTFTLTIGISERTRRHGTRLLRNDYCQISRALGAPPILLLIRHIYPQLRKTLFQRALFGFALITQMDTWIGTLGLGAKTCIFGRLYSAVLFQHAPFSLIYAPTIALTCILLVVQMFLNKTYDPHPSHLSS